MVQSSDNTMRFIRQQCPEIDVAGISEIIESHNNYSVVMSDRTVYRLPKGPLNSLGRKRESAILEALTGQTSLPVPRLIKSTANYDLLTYIPGSPLRWDILLSFSETARDRIAEQIADFLKELHGLSKPETPQTPVQYTPQSVSELYDNIQQELYPHLRRYVRRWIESLFEEALSKGPLFEFSPLLIHGDLYPDHILYDEDSHLLTGIVDFGNSGMGNTAVDIGLLLYSYGGGFVDRILHQYPELSSAVDQARFLCQLTDLERAVIAMRKGGGPAILGHLGRAMDLGSG